MGRFSRVPKLPANLHDSIIAAPPVLQCVLQRHRELQAEGVAMAAGVVSGVWLLSVADEIETAVLPHDDDDRNSRCSIAWIDTGPLARRPPGRPPDSPRPVRRPASRHPNRCPRVPTERDRSWRDGLAKPGQPPCFSSRMTPVVPSRKTRKCRPVSPGITSIAVKRDRLRATWPTGDSGHRVGLCPGPPARNGPARPGVLTYEG